MYPIVLPFASRGQELYHKRWGQETSFRDLKYTIDIVSFHSKKREYVEQEALKYHIRIYRYLNDIGTGGRCLIG